MNIKELLHLPAHKLKHLVKIKTEMERLEHQLANVIVATTPSFVGKVIKAKRKMSAAAKAKISAAAKARWAKVRGAKAPQKGKRTMSAVARRKIAAAAKARWAKVKAAGKKRL